VTDKAETFRPSHGVFGSIHNNSVKDSTSHITKFIIRSTFSTTLDIILVLA
jgi:hypothetical protein